jgi:hypothetical protein
LLHLKMALTMKENAPSANGQGKGTENNSEGGHNVLLEISLTELSMVDQRGINDKWFFCLSASDWGVRQAASCRRSATSRRCDGRVRPIKWLFHFDGITLCRWRRTRSCEKADGCNSDPVCDQPLWGCIRQQLHDHAARGGDERARTNDAMLRR